MHRNPDDRRWEMDETKCMARTREKRGLLGRVVFTSRRLVVGITKNPARWWGTYKNAFYVQDPNTGVPAKGVSATKRAFQNFVANERRDS